MEFISNNCVAVRVKDLNEAEKFYNGIMGFEVIGRKDNYIAFNTGHYILYADKSERLQSPVPSFSVTDINEAKYYVASNGCEITEEGDKYFWFKDPFGFTFDVIEKKIRQEK